MKLFENSFPSSARFDDDGFETTTRKDDGFTDPGFAAPMPQQSGASRNLFDDMPLPTTQVKDFHSRYPSEHFK